MGEGGGGRGESSVDVLYVRRRGWILSGEGVIYEVSNGVYMISRRIGKGRRFLVSSDLVDVLSRERRAHQTRI